MFYPRAMTEIELIVPSKDLLAVTKSISGQGVFHQVDSAYLSSGKDSASASIWHEKAAMYSTLERRIQSIMAALNVQEGQPPQTDFEAMVVVDDVRPQVDEIEQQVKFTGERLSTASKRVEQLEIATRQLEPIAGIDLDISSLHSHRFLFSMLGTIPTAGMDRLQTSLARIPFVFLPLRQEPGQSVVWLAGTRNNADILERAARSAYLNPLSLPSGYSGSPSEVIQSIKIDIASEQKAISELKTAQAELGKTLCQRLQSLLWEIRASRLLTDAIVRFGQLRYTYVIVGWVPTDAIAEFTSRIKKVSKEALIETFNANRQVIKHDIPVDLYNPKFLRPFQSLVTTYARPRYDEIDPTLLLAITFPLLYGAMFGDVGQGLVLLLLGLLLSSRKVKSLRGLAGLGGIISACGSVATIFGFLYGSFFGFEEVIPALWFHPVKDITRILVIAIGAGVVLLIIGFLISMYNSYRVRDWGHLFFNHYGVAGFLLYLSFLGLGAGALIPAMPVPSSVFLVAVIVFALVLMFSEVFIHLIEGHRPLIEGSVGIYVTQAFFELFESVIGFLSNTLSYVRVGAFAVAHGGLSAVFFIIAEMVSPGKGIGYWIVFLIGTIFIIGFEGLIVGIQTMRLSYYELFGKFFRGGGASFEPLKLRPAENE